MKAKINKDGDLVIGSAYLTPDNVAQDDYILRKFKEDFNNGKSGIYFDIDGKSKLLIRTDSGDNAKQK